MGGLAADDTSQRDKTVEASAGHGRPGREDRDRGRDLERAGYRDAFMARAGCRKRRDRPGRELVGDVFVEPRFDDGDVRRLPRKALRVTRGAALAGGCRRH